MNKYFYWVKLVVMGLLLISFLGGCRTISDTRENPGGTFYFEMDESYEDVYRMILDHAVTCYTPAQAYGNIYADSKRATINIGPVGADLIIDIVRLDDGRSSIETIYDGYRLGNKSQAQGVEKWAKEDSEICHFYMH